MLKDCHRIVRRRSAYVCRFGRFVLRGGFIPCKLRRILQRLLTIFSGYSRAVHNLHRRLVRNHEGKHLSAVVSLFHLIGRALGRCDGHRLRIQHLIGRHRIPHYQRRAISHLDAGRVGIDLIGGHRLRAVRRVQLRLIRQQLLRKARIFIGGSRLCGTVVPAGGILKRRLPSILRRLLHDFLKRCLIFRDQPVADMKFLSVFKFFDLILFDMENDLALLHICGKHGSIPNVRVSIRIRQFTGVTDIQSRHCLVRLHIPQPCVERIRHIEVLGCRSLHLDGEMPCGVGFSINRDRLGPVRLLYDLLLRHIYLSRIGYLLAIPDEINIIRMLHHIGLVSFVQPVLIDLRAECHGDRADFVSALQPGLRMRLVLIERVNGLRRIRRRYILHHILAVKKSLDLDSGSIPLIISPLVVHPLRRQMIDHLGGLQPRLRNGHRDGPGNRLVVVVARLLGDTDLAVRPGFHVGGSAAVMPLVVLHRVADGCFRHHTGQIRIRRIGNHILIGFLVRCRNRIVPRRRRRQISDAHIRPGLDILPDLFIFGVRHHHRDAVSGILQNTP